MVLIKYSIYGNFDINRDKNEMVKRSICLTTLVKQYNLTLLALVGDHGLNWTEMDSLEVDYCVMISVNNLCYGPNNHAWGKPTC